MTTPTKDGYYWARHFDAKDWEVVIREGNRTRLFYEEWSLDSNDFEWGEKIERNTLSLRSAFDAGVDHGMLDTEQSNKSAFEEWSGWDK